MRAALLTFLAIAVFVLGFSHVAVVQVTTTDLAATPAGQKVQLTTDDYYDIGDFHQPVSTESAEAQLWFDRGLAMCYGFNHEEAVRCFEQALKHDATMPMAYWGIAYAWGPYINNTEIAPHQLAQAGFALRLAELHSHRATPVERQLIEALAKRHVMPVPEDRQPLNEAYADAIREIHEKHPDNPMVTSLFAESLMILRPWQFWSPDGKAAPETPEIVEVLESGLERWPDHPALCHYYIHAMEASPHPEKALPAANQLRNAMPGSGHLVHMPTHIDVRVGDYERVVRDNQKAIELDAEYVRRHGPYNFYSIYRIHNYHFLVYGAMFEGHSELALETARQLVNQVPEDMLKEQVDMLDAFMPMPLHVLIRFGRWEDILSEPEPADYLPVTRSMWHYARAVAYAATGRIVQAEQEQAAFRREFETVPETSTLFQNTSRDILAVADSMIEGEIQYRKGNYEVAFEHLREAVRRDDALNYDEPWGWMQPARHALGALLLEQKRFADAETVYRLDLKRHPNNIWALTGLADCLEQLDRADEAVEIRRQIDKAAKRTDITIDRSCFCKNQDNN